MVHNGTVVKIIRAQLSTLNFKLLEQKIVPDMKISVFSIFDCSTKISEY